MASCAQYQPCLKLVTGQITERNALIVVFSCFFKQDTLGGQPFVQNFFADGLLRRIGVMDAHAPSEWPQLLMDIGCLWGVPRLENATKTNKIRSSSICLSAAAALRSPDARGFTGSDSHGFSSFAGEGVEHLDRAAGSHLGQKEMM